MGPLNDETAKVVRETSLQVASIVAEFPVDERVKMCDRLIRAGKTRKSQELYLQLSSEWQNLLMLLAFGALQDSIEAERCEGNIEYHFEKLEE